MSLCANVPYMGTRWLYAVAGNENPTKILAQLVGSAKLKYETTIPNNPQGKLCSTPPEATH